MFEDPATRLTEKPALRQKSLNKKGAQRRLVLLHDFSPAEVSPLEAKPILQCGLFCQPHARQWAIGINDDKQLYAKDDLPVSQFCLN